VTDFGALLATLGRHEVAFIVQLVYLDQVAGDVADAYVPQVRYTVNGSIVQIRLRLVAASGRQEQLLQADTRDPVELARQIVAKLVQMAASLKPR
jgi:hypothetical protein